MGAKLEFYRTNIPLSREFPLIPNGLELEVCDPKPSIAEEDKARFEQFVNKLGIILANTE